MISSLNRFLEYISEHKIWAFASSVFVACFWFSAHTFINMPNELAELEQRENDLDKIELEGVVTDAIYGHVEDALNTSQEALETYDEFRQRVTEEQKIPEREVILEYYTEILSLNNDISRSIANLESLQSNNDAIDSYADEFSADLKAFQVTFDEMENVFVALLEGDESAALDHVITQTQSMIQIPIYLEKTWNRFMGFNAEIDSLLSDAESELNSLYRDRNTLYRNLNLSIISIVYMLVFGTAFFRTWYSRTRSTKVNSSNKKSTNTKPANTKSENVKANSIKPDNRKTPTKSKNKKKKSKTRRKRRRH